MFETFTFITVLFCTLFALIAGTIRLLRYLREERDIKRLIARVIELSEAPQLEQ